MAQLSMPIPRSLDESRRWGCLSENFDVLAIKAEVLEEGAAKRDGAPRIASERTLTGRLEIGLPKASGPRLR